MEQITVSNIRIDVVRKAIKNIHLAVYPPTGRVRIAAPLRTNDDAIRLFAIAKLGWIKRHQRKFESQDRMPPREYRERESHYYMGRRYLLHLKETDGHSKVVLKSKKYLELHIHPGATAEQCHHVLTEWYRARLKEKIPLLLEKWEKKLKLKVSDWRVKQMRTKWGSCNIAKKRIWLNLELAKKSPACLDYVILHELVHLLERHHNDRFQYYLDKYLPDWKKVKIELNRMAVGDRE